MVRSLGEEQGEELTILLGKAVTALNTLVIQVTRGKCDFKESTLYQHTEIVYIEIRRHRHCRLSLMLSISAILGQFSGLVGG